MKIPTYKGLHEYYPRWPGDWDEMRERLREAAQGRFALYFPLHEGTTIFRIEPASKGSQTFVRSIRNNKEHVTTRVLTEQTFFAIDTSSEDMEAWLWRGCPQLMEVVIDFRFIDPADNSYWKLPTPDNFAQGWLPSPLHGEGLYINPERRTLFTAEDEIRYGAPPGSLTSNESYRTVRDRYEAENAVNDADGLVPLASPAAAAAAVRDNNLAEQAEIAAAAPVKRKRGRPRKNAAPAIPVPDGTEPVKRKRGRPRKIPEAAL